MCLLLLLDHIMIKTRLVTLRSDYWGGWGATGGWGEGAGAVSSVRNQNPTAKDGWERGRKGGVEEGAGHCLFKARIQRHGVVGNEHIRWQRGEKAGRRQQERDGGRGYAAGRGRGSSRISRGGAAPRRRHREGDIPIVQFATVSAGFHQLEVDEHLRLWRSRPDWPPRPVFALRDDPASPAPICPPYESN